MECLDFGDKRYERVREKLNEQENGVGTEAYLTTMCYAWSYIPLHCYPWCPSLEPRPLLYLKLRKYLFQPCSLAHSSEIIFTLGLRRLVRPLAIICKYAEHFSTTTRRNSTKDSHNSGNLKPYSLSNSVWVFKVPHWSLIIEGIVRWGLRFIVLIREDLQV